MGTSVAQRQFAASDLERDLALTQVGLAVLEGEPGGTADLTRAAKAIEVLLHFLRRRLHTLSRSSLISEGLVPVAGVREALQNTLSQPKRTSGKTATRRRELEELERLLLEALQTPKLGGSKSARILELLDALEGTSPTGTGYSLHVPPRPAEA